MKLKEYIELLNNIVDSNPDALEYIMVYVKDDEGNYFDTLTYGPGPGRYIKEDNQFNSDADNPNAICVN